MTGLEIGVRLWHVNVGEEFLAEADQGAQLLHVSPHFTLSQQTYYAYFGSRVINPKIFNVLRCTFVMTVKHPQVSVPIEDQCFVW